MPGCLYFAAYASAATIKAGSVSLPAFAAPASCQPAMISNFSTPSAAAGTGEFYAAARRHLIRPLRGHLPLKGKANGGAAFNGAKPSRGRLEGVSFDTANPPRGRLTSAGTPHPALRATFPSRGRLWGGAIQYRGPPRGKALGGTPLEGKA